MKLSTVDLDMIPLLDGAAALFGTVIQAGGRNDDRIVQIMIYLYEIIPN